MYEEVALIDGEVALKNTWLLQALGDRLPILLHQAPLHELEGIGTYAEFSPEWGIHRYDHENDLSYKQGHKAG